MCRLNHIILIDMMRGTKPIYLAIVDQKPIAAKPPLAYSAAMVFIIVKFIGEVPSMECKIILTTQQLEEIKFWCQTHSGGYREFLESKTLARWFKC